MRYINQNLDFPLRDNLISGRTKKTKRISIRATLMLEPKRVDHQGKLI